MTDSPTVTLFGATMNIKTDVDVDLYDLADRLDIMRDDMDHNSGDFETISQALAAIKHLRSESMEADRDAAKIVSAIDEVVDSVIFGNAGRETTRWSAPYDMGASLADILTAAMRDHSTPRPHRHVPISTGNNYGKITMIKAMREYMAEHGMTVTQTFNSARGYIGLKEAKDITEHMIAANEEYIRDQQAQGNL